MKKVEDKYLEYNLKLHDDYLYLSDKRGWKVIRNKMFVYEVLNSDKNTEKELEAFVKSKHKYDYVKADSLFCVTVSFLILILNTINIFIKSHELRWFICGGLVVLVLKAIYNGIVVGHNDKINYENIKQDAEYLEKINIEKSKEKKSDKKRVIPKNKENK